MDKEDRFWKSEYENLRRKKNKELETQRQRFHDFVLATYKLLKLLGMKEKDIYGYFKKELHL